jgi:hypothetical protein
MVSDQEAVMRKGDLKRISVFIASPGDLAPERKIFKDTIDALNAGFADGAGVEFVPIGWEDVLAETGRRPQAVINRELDQCDLFILALHRRWGQDAPDSKFSSYTEEEFQLAFRLWKKRKTPEVLVFFKTVDSASVADPGVQLKEVLHFRKKLEQGHATLIRSFNTDVDFGKEIDRHLRAFARGEYKDLGDDSPAIAFPKAEVTVLNKARREGAKRVEREEKQRSSAKRESYGKGKRASAAKADLRLVKAHQTDVTLARAAVDAARGGRIQDARILFAKATEDTTELSVLSVAAEFFRQIGDLDNASRLVQRQAAIARDRTIAARHYLALMPPGFTGSLMEQVMAQMVAQFPEELAAEIRSIAEEVYGGGKVERILLDLMVKYYTEGEIVQLARFLASPAGQSSLQKQPAMMMEMFEFGQREFQRVFSNRHPELAAGNDQLQSEPVGDANLLAAPAEQADQRPAGDADRQSLASTQGPDEARKAS